MDKIIYQNYHRHSFYSNIIVPDSAVSNEDYAKRTKELGHKILSSVEHGYQGYYYQTYELAKKYGLKFIFGAEAYWVKDRFEKDNTNNHIIICAKTEKGRRAINSILSEANITGYYYKARVDLELLLSLPKDDVFITTACISFWRYKDSNDIVKQLHNHFGNNFMLEVQYHYTPKQISLNKRILELSRKLGIQIIMGCDSHYIYPSDSSERDNVLQAKGVMYEEENGWYMDYPTGEEAFARFQNQEVFSNEEIKQAMENTNIFLTFDDITFDKEIKLPTLYPNKTQREKNEIFIRLIYERWCEERKEIPISEHDKYIEEIKKEVTVVINTNLADYFLLDYHLVKNAVANGGIITKSGRGSGASYYINKLLGFTNVDRISASVKMYPERFISETRILQSKSLADLDLNLGTVDIFAKAQNDLLGEGHAYPMIAFGTFKVKSAFKLYARAKELDFDIANEISQQLDSYETALKYADDDEKDLVDINDYVEEQYMSYIEESKKYQGIISDKKAHPCGYLIYSGDIKSEIGLIKCKSESTGKETITTVVDGYVAETYKFLKNDLLKVDVVLHNAKVYERVGIPPLSVKQLLKSCDSKVWDIYKNGLTQCINQVEKSNTTIKVIKYQPRNISELTAFIASIRPSFKTMYHIFESRKDFSYNIKAFDKILKTEELPYSFVLYQEQMMATLQYAGFPVDETYNIIKAIAKKHPEIVKPLKDKFKQGFGNRIKEEEPHLTNDEVSIRCDDVWQIIEDASGYGFNSSHAYCVALDSLDSAYLKVNYPFEFYEVMLNAYAEKGNKEKVSALLLEMDKGFSIKLGKYKFGNDNRGFRMDKENNIINPSLKSIKYLNQEVSNDLYELGKNNYNNFIELLFDIEKNASVNSRQMEILIKLNFFSEFGNNKKLLHIYNYFQLLANKKQLKKEVANKYGIGHLAYTFARETDKTYMDLNSTALLMEIETITPNESFSLQENVKFEMEYFGYITTIMPSLSDEYVVVTAIECKYKNPVITLYRFQDGQIENIKVKKNTFDAYPLQKFDVIRIIRKFEDFRWKRNSDGSYKRLEEKEWFLSTWNRIK